MPEALGLYNGRFGTSSKFGPQGPFVRVKNDF